MSHTVMGKNRFHNDVEMSTDSLLFRPGIYGIILHDEKILLVPSDNGYDLPGGGIELGEKLHDAVKREVKEETGYDVSVVSIVDCDDSFFTFDEKHNYHSILVYAVCTVVDWNPIKQKLGEYEHTTLNVRPPEWLSLKSLSSIKINSTVDFRPVLTRLIANGYEF